MASLTAAARSPPLLPSLLWLPLLLLPDPPPGPDPCVPLRAPTLLPAEPPLPTETPLLPVLCCLCAALVRWLSPEASSIWSAFARLATALRDVFMLWLWNCSIQEATSSASDGSIPSPAPACSVIMRDAQRHLISQRPHFNAQVLAVRLARALSILLSMHKL